MFACLVVHLQCKVVSCSSIGKLVNFFQLTLSISCDLNCNTKKFYANYQPHYQIYMRTKKSWNSQNNEVRISKIVYLKLFSKKSLFNRVLHQHHDRQTDQQIKRKSENTATHLQLTDA